MGDQYPPYGVGAGQHEQGSITVRVVYDVERAKQQKNSAAMGRSVYRQGSEDDYHVRQYEYLFAEKNPVKRIDKKKGSHQTKVLTSFSGAGEIAHDLFRDDEAMQIASLLNHSRFVGVAKTPMNFNDTAKHQGLTAQVAGVTSHMAYVDMPAGMSVKLGLPKPSAHGLDDRLLEKGVPPTKVRMQPEPFVPRDLGPALQAHISKYLEDTQRYLNGMGVEYRSTDATVSAVEHVFQTGLTAGLLFMSGLADNKILDDITFRQPGTSGAPMAAVGTGPPAPYNMQDPNLRAARPKNQEVILALASAFGLIGQDASVGQGIPGISRMSAEQKRRYVALRRDVLGKIFWDGTKAQLGFGYDHDRKINPFVNQEGKRIRLDTPQGAFMNLQLNHTAAFVSAVSEWWDRAQDWVIGKIMMGAVAGRRWALIQKK